MDYLDLANKTIAVFGVANRKSVAWHIATQLREVGAEVVFIVRSEKRKEELSRLISDASIYVCDVEDETQVARLRDDVAKQYDRLDGLVHSIAFAEYEDGVKPFHETTKREFLRAVDISCYSLMAICNAFKDLLAPEASVVTISISTTRMASENYGYMAPIKAALDSSICFLAKSFSRFSKIRFNAVAPGLLKTSASAGIPGYVDSYLYAEKVIPRGEAVRTEEAAGVALFLLSPRSSGVNAQQIVVDAGMSINYFDRDLIEEVMDARSPDSKG